MLCFPRGGATWRIFRRKFTGLVTHFNNFFIRPQIVAAAVRSCKIEDNRLYFNKKQQNKLCGRDKAHIWQEIQGFLNKVVLSCSPITLYGNRMVPYNLYRNGVINAETGPVGTEMDHRTPKACYFHRLLCYNTLTEIPDRLVEVEGRMAEWLRAWACSPDVVGSRPTFSTCIVLECP